MAKVIKTIDTEDDNISEENMNSVVLYVGGLLTRIAIKHELIT